MGWLSASCSRCVVAEFGGDFFFADKQYSYRKDVSVDVSSSPRNKRDNVSSYT